MVPNQQSCWLKQVQRLDPVTKILLVASVPLGFIRRVWDGMFVLLWQGLKGLWKFRSTYCGRLRSKVYQNPFSIRNLQLKEIWDCGFFLHLRVWFLLLLLLVFFSRAAVSTRFLLSADWACRSLTGDWPLPPSPQQDGGNKRNKQVGLDKGRGIAHQLVSQAKHSWI